MPAIDFMYSFVAAATADAAAADDEGDGCVRGYMCVLCVCEPWI